MAKIVHLDKNTPMSTCSDITITIWSERQMTACESRALMNHIRKLPFVYHVLISEKQSWRAGGASRLRGKS